MENTIKPIPVVHADCGALTRAEALEKLGLVTTDEPKKENPNWRTSH